MKTITIIICGLLWAAIINAQVIHVPADQPTIQAGINAATDGDTVMVAEGTYYENINFLGKAITVASHFIMDADTSHISNTVIDGSQPADPNFGSAVILNSGEDTTSMICGFTITGGTGLFVQEYDMFVGGGIATNNAGVKVLNNKITGNEINHTGYAMGGGIGCLSEDEINWLVARDNLISGNHCYSDGIEALGAGVYAGTKMIFENNEVSYNTCTGINNAESNAAGIVNASPSHNVVFEITDNFIHHNHCEGDYVIVGVGVYLWFGEGVVSGNQVCHNNGTTEFQGMGGGMYIHAATGIVYINDNEFLANSLDGNAVQGGGVQIDQASEKIYIERNLFQQNTLDGYTVAGGGGLVIYDCNEVLVNQNTFQGNVLNGGMFSGGGIYVINPLAKTEIRNNHFAANEGVGMGFGGGASMFSGYNVPVEIDANIFEGNSMRAGGGLYTYNCYNTTVSNNLFSGNNASVMGGGYRMRHYGGKSHETLLPVDLLVRTISGSVHHSTRVSDYPILVNNSFVNNSSTQGGAIYCDHQTAFPLIMNSIFWGNEAINAGNDIYLAAGSEASITYCDVDTSIISGNWTGIGNINEDPLFDLSGPHPYALMPGSPCIDTGTPDTTGLCLPVCDIIGCYRIWDGDGDGIAVVDMGAYEFDSPVVGIAKPVVAKKETKLTVYPNPFHSSITIEFELKAKTPVILQVYNHMGQLVAVLLNESRAPGSHQLTWKAAHMPSGLYFLRLQAGNELRTGKVIKQ